MFISVGSGWRAPKRQRENVVIVDVLQPPSWGGLGMMMQHKPTEISDDYTHLIIIDDVFIPYIAATLTRLGYLYKDMEFIFVEGSVYVRNIQQADIESLKCEILHLLYREKILRETLRLRELIYSRVFER